MSVAEAIAYLEGLPLETWPDEQHAAVDHALQLLEIAHCNGASPPAVVDVPTDYIEGVDVSGWQDAQKIDYSEMREDFLGGRGFLIAKASQGGGWSKHFTQHWTDAYRAGLIPGAYHYARLYRNRRGQKASGKSQATHFYKRVMKVAKAAGADIQGLLCLDLEWQKKGAKYTNAGVRKFVADFDERIFELSGKHCILYTMHSFWRYRTNYADFASDEIELWQAGYKGDGKTTHDDPDVPGLERLPTSMLRRKRRKKISGWDKPLIWQFAGGKGRLQDGDGDGRIAYGKRHTAGKGRPIDRNAATCSWPELVARGA